MRRRNVHILLVLILIIWYILLLLIYIHLLSLLLLLILIWNLLLYWLLILLWLLIILLLRRLLSRWRIHFLLNPTFNLSEKRSIIGWSLSILLLLLICRLLISLLSSCSLILHWDIIHCVNMWICFWERKTSTHPFSRMQPTLPAIFLF